MIPEHLVRYPTREGRESLAARLHLFIDPTSQDWEYEVADADRFQDWIAVYRDESLSYDERFSLMEILIQCVEDICDGDKSAEQLPEWQAVAALLLANGRLHSRVPQPQLIPATSHSVTHGSAPRTPTSSPLVKAPSSFPALAQSPGPESDHAVPECLLTRPHSGH